MIRTHRDVAPRNCLLDGDRVSLLDWDVAGPWSAAEEVAAAAVECAGGTTDDPRPEVAGALLEGYRASGGVLRPYPPHVLAAWLAKNANWVLLAARRALREVPCSAGQRQDADRLAGGWADGLVAGVDRLPQWSELLREASR
jgi:thiamine kinase-like enzyme